MPDACKGLTGLTDARTIQVDRVDRGVLMAIQTLKYEGVAAPTPHVKILEAVAKELAIVDPDGSAAIGDVSIFARLVSVGLGTAGVWSEHLGPMYDADGVRTLLRITKQAVSKRQSLLALTTGNGRVVYPAFQFVGPKVVDGMAQIRAILPKPLVSPWTVASWLNSPERELDDQKPIDLLRSGVIKPVVEVAHDWAQALSQ
jgi:hypothetical protein